MMMTMTGITTWAGNVREYISTTITSNYGAVCQFTPNLVLSWTIGVLDANNSYKRRFGANAFNSEHTYGAKFLLQDWLSSRSSFAGTSVGILFYWLGGISFSSTRTSFLVDQLYWSVWTYPYDMVDIEKTVIPYFYPKFSGAPVVTNNPSEKIETQIRAENAEKLYRPTYLVYHERRKETLTPLSERLYIDRAECRPKNGDAGIFYVDVNPFTGQRCSMKEKSVWGPLAYFQSYLMTHLGIAKFQDLMSAGYNRFKALFNLDTYIGDSQEKSDSEPKKKGEKGAADWVLRKELEKLDYRKQIRPDYIVDPTSGRARKATFEETFPHIGDQVQSFIETYRIRRVVRESVGNSQLLITLPDAMNQAQWDNDKQGLAAQLAQTQGAEIAFMHEWTTEEIHNRAAELIELITAKRARLSDQRAKNGEPKLPAPRITYHDVNPRDCLTERLLSALPALEGPPVKPRIYTVGMENPNVVAKKLPPRETGTSKLPNIEGRAYASTLPRHKIEGAKEWFKSSARTLFAMTTAEFMADILRISMDRAWEAGSFMVLLSNPHLIFDGLMLLPKFLLKVSVAPLKLGLYLTTMAYFHFSGKSESVFELPSESTDVSNKTMLMPKNLMFSVGAVKEGLSAQENPEIAADSELETDTDHSDRNSFSPR